MGRALGVGVPRGGGEGGWEERREGTRRRRRERARDVFLGEDLDVILFCRLSLYLSLLTRARPSPRRSRPLTAMASPPAPLAPEVAPEAPTAATAPPPPPPPPFPSTTPAALASLQAFLGTALRRAAAAVAPLDGEAGLVPPGVACVRVGLEQEEGGGWRLSGERRKKRGQPTAFICVHALTALHLSLSLSLSQSRTRASRSTTACR